MTDRAERLQKYLARAGVASRRAAEALITEGRVQVNGKVVRELGTTIDPLVDEVRFDGERIGVDVRHVYLMVNKPPAMISAASDPEGRPVVTDLVPPEYGRLYPVGRLDWDSEGAILLTNDGELANLLTHPRHEVRKTYMVKVKGLVRDDDRNIAKLREGVKLDDGKRTLPAEVIRDSDTGKHTWFVVSIREGRNRQIRRMFEAVGIDVLRLRRIAYGPVSLGDVPPAEFRRLTEEEIDELYEAAGAKRPAASASRGRLPQSKRAATERRARAAAQAPAAGAKGSSATSRRSDGPSRAAKGGASSDRRSDGSSRPAKGGASSDRRSEGSSRPTKGGASTGRRSEGQGRPAKGASGTGSKRSETAAPKGESRGSKPPKPASARGDKPSPRPKHRGARGRSR